MIESFETYVNTQLGPALATVAARGLGVILVLLAGVALHIVLGAVFRRVVRFSDESSLTDQEQSKQFATALGLIKTIALALMWGVIAVSAVGQAGFNITPILASAGIVGLAVGFGAQHIVRDLISGTFNILENQIRVGDVVKINGVGGLVEKITYRIVVLRDFSHDVHVFPHGKVETLTNMTKSFSGAVIDVPVAYRTDLRRAIEVIAQVGESMTSDPRWEDQILEPLEIVGVEDFADSAIVIRTRFKTKPIKQWNAAREFRLRLKIAFDREGIEIPFPQRSLSIAPDSPPLPVRPLEDLPKRPKPRGRKKRD